ncbi:MAG: amidohydrolase family protein [Bacillota bacterium]
MHRTTAALSSHNNGERMQLANCNVLDIRHGRILRDSSVTIESGVIEDVGGLPSRYASVLNTIDLGGLTVVPGLVDAHVHTCMTGDGSALNRYLSEPSRVTLLRSMANLSRSLRAGVTTIRDVGSPTPLILLLRDLQAQGLIAGPRILASGSVVTTEGGHCHYFGVQVQGVPAIQTAVHDLAVVGVDFIKVMGSGGNLTNGTDPSRSQFSYDEMKALVSAARGAEKKVSCHAHSEEAIAVAIEAGVDSIEHGSYATKHQIDLMSQRRICLVPTLAPASRTLKVLGQNVSETVKDRVWCRIEATMLAIERGVRILAGTDAGIPHMPHGNVAEEVIRLAQLGLSPVDAMRAAMTNVCEWLGIADKLGAVEQGMLADLLVIEGNPLENPTTLSKPIMVIQGGTVVCTNSEFI